MVSRNKLKYKPFAITDAVFINKGGYFSDTKTNLTSRYLSNLKIFNYPSIIYEQDKKDLEKRIADNEAFIKLTQSQYNKLYEKKYPYREIVWNFNHGTAVINLTGSPNLESDAATFASAQP